jgi:aspartate-semialdehyde dehydrogenase
LYGLGGEGMTSKVAGNVSSKVMRVAIAGASSLAGKELSDALSDSPLGAASFTLLDDEQTSGRVAAAGDEISFIQKMEGSLLAGMDLVFFTGEPEEAKKYGAAAIRAGASVVDMTGGLEGMRGVLVRSPWIRGGGGGDEAARAPTLETTAVVPAHAAAVMLAMVASRLQAKFAVRSMAATLLLPASEFGRGGMDELHQQTVSLLSFQSVPREQYGTQVAFNLARSSGEGAKVRVEAVEERVKAHFGGLMGKGGPELALHAAHAAVFHGYVASVWVELESATGVAAVEEALAGELIEVMMAEAEAEAPDNLTATGQQAVLVSVGAAGGAGTRFGLWMAADNLQLGAANAIACALELVALRPTSEIQ